MRFDELREIMRRAGIVGAGGAGFPSYAKLNIAADTVILNCSECEPLLKLHRQLLARYANEILSTLQEMADTLRADRVIVAVKKTYTETLEAVRALLADYPKVQLCLVGEFYPAGDEIVTVYEATGRVVAPGERPITVGCIVYNVETVYNIYCAWKKNEPVTHKYVTVAGEVQNPCTLRVPVGIRFGELIAMVGGATIEDFSIISGGPMMGRVVSADDVVTKTSNAILVLPKNASVILKKTTPITINVKRAMAACCQCQMCTDLCPRHQLGHPIEPHKIMRAVASGVSADTEAFLGAFSCSSCGLCTMYSCGQGLNPAAIIATTKSALSKNGITPPKSEASSVEPMREYRKAAMPRLGARLGLAKYDVSAPIVDVEVKTRIVKLKLVQGIGAPAAPVVTVGQRVAMGQLIADVAPDKLGTAIHAPFDGMVTEVTDAYVLVLSEAKCDKRTV